MIKQGENGDHFYIVNKGSYQAFLSQAGDKPVATYGEGDSFGELALLYTAPRAATVICKEAGSVWAIERKIFRYIMVQTGADQSKKIDGFLKSVSLLSVLTDQQRSTLANHIEEKRYVDSEYICEVRSSAAPLFAPHRSCKQAALPPHPLSRTQPPGKLNYPQEDFPKDMFKEFASEWVN